MTSRSIVLAAILIASTWALASCPPSPKGSAGLHLVTTTSIQDSGLLDRLVPAAERSLGFPVKVIAVGSGEALKFAERGEADVLIAHSPAAEEDIVRRGHVVDRASLMWNRFVIVGPASDSARILGLRDAVEAFKRIRAAGVPFVSRGDESGTHKKEQEIWKAAGLSAADAHVIATGQGQGESLMLASQREAYALCDSSTWAKMKPGGLVVLVDPPRKTGTGGVSLINRYHVMRENEAVHPSTNSDSAKRFVAWVMGPQAAQIIISGGFGLGEPLPE